MSNFQLLAAVLERIVRRVEVYDCPLDISPQISDNILNPAEVLKTLKSECQ
jgi:hypothetical protein